MGQRSIHIVIAGVILLLLLIVSSASAQTQVSISAAVSSDDQSVVITLNGSVDPGSTCGITVTQNDGGSPEQYQDCSAWPGGSPISYTFPVTPGESYSASYSIYNPHGSSTAGGPLSFSVPLPTDPAPAPVPTDNTPTMTVLIAPSVDLDVTQITDSGAVLVLSGSTEAGSSCAISVTNGDSDQQVQSLDCSGWTGGEKDITVKGLQAYAAYTASVKVETPEGVWATAGIGWLTKKKTWQGCPANQRLVGGKCQAKPPRDREVSLIAACSRRRLPHRDQQCGAGSNPALRIKSTEPAKIKVCIYPTHYGHGDLDKAMRCSRAIRVKKNRPITVQLWKLIRHRPSLARIKKVMIIAPYRGNAIVAQQHLRFSGK